MKEKGAEREGKQTLTFNLSCFRSDLLRSINTDLGLPHDTHTYHTMLRYCQGAINRHNKREERDKNKRERREREGIEGERKRKRRRKKEREKQKKEKERKREREEGKREKQKKEKEREENTRKRKREKSSYPSQTLAVSIDASSL